MIHYTPMKRHQHIFLNVFDIGTIFLMGWFLWAFFSHEATTVSKSFVDIYLLILTFIASDKEIHRWRHHQRPGHRHGEYFVYSWIGVLLLMVGIEIFGGAEHGYHLPHELAFAVTGAVVIFGITEYIKSEFRKKG